MVIIAIGRNQAGMQIDVWRNLLAPPNLQITRADLNATWFTPSRTQHITITLQGQPPNHTSVVNGAPLRLSFDDIFLRAPSPPPSSEQDFIYGQAELQELAELVWMAQEFL